jgi:purine-binding chemotaxis protein CheW
MPPASAAAARRAPPLTLGCFEVGGRNFGILVSELREVVRWSPPTPLPRAPQLVEGVIDLRGVVLPIVDLGRALGLAPVEPGLTARIAVVEVAGLLLGLAVQAALEVMAFEGARLEDAPALASPSGHGLARGVVRRPEAPPLVVLSLEGLLELVRGSRLAEAQA